MVGQRWVGRWGAVRARGERARARTSPNILQIEDSQKLQDDLRTQREGLERKLKD